MWVVVLGYVALLMVFIVDYLTLLLIGKIYVVFLLVTLLLLRYAKVFNLHRIIGKTICLANRIDATIVCCSDQLCAGLSSGIEGLFML